MLGWSGHGFCCGWDWIWRVGRSVPTDPGRGLRLGDVGMEPSVAELKASVWWACPYAWARSQAKEGHLVDALALRGDEGRGTLRKTPGSWEQALIRGYPNGATRPARVIVR